MMNPKPGSASSWRPIWVLTPLLCRCLKRLAVSYGKQARYLTFLQCSLRMYCRTIQVLRPISKTAVSTGRAAVPPLPAAASPVRAAAPIGQKAAAPVLPPAMLRTGLPGAARPGISLADPVPPVMRIPQTPAAGQAGQTGGHVSYRRPALNIPALLRVPKSHFHL